MLALLAVGYLANQGWLRVISRIAACVLLLIFAADIATNTLLAQRLYWGDLIRFGKHAGNDFSVMRAALGSRPGMIAIAIGAVALIASTSIVFARRQPRIGQGALLTALACASVWGYTAIRPVHYVQDVFLDNVIEANFPQGRIAPFSAGFIEAQRTLADVAPKQCSAGEQTGGSVIVLIVESLSSWHSHLLGAAQDWTPRLDEIARSNHYISQFHANGFTTSAAEIAVLSGRMPLIPSGKFWFDFSDYTDPSGTLPDIAHRSGREAAFFTTGDLSFLGLGDWLRQLGFDVVGGSKDAFYAGRQRWQFDAADDESLYARFLQWLDQRDPEKPFVSALLTVSSHPPYVDPRTSKVDAEASFRYVDEQIGRFHGELEKRGFFKNGILLVLGDHHTMTPLRDDEFRAYGERAFSRIPLVVVGATDMPAVVNSAFQQSDIPASIGQWLGLRECSSSFSGLFLRADPEPADYVLHARGDNRNRVDVYHSDGFNGFLLDGDNSSWVGKPPPNANSIAAWIDWQREQARSRGLAPQPGRTTAKP